MNIAMEIIYLDSVFINIYKIIKWFCIELCMSHANFNAKSFNYFGVTQVSVS